MPTGGLREPQAVIRLDDAAPLLETKLYVPEARRGLVAPPRLSERLSRGAESKLTLVSAPAGFGKTTLLAEWLEATSGDQRSTAWLSLDSRDSQAASFWSYMIAALRTVAEGLGATSLSLLQKPQAPPIETVLASLLNELSALSNDVVLVLDDYHVIEAQDIHEGMAFLLEHLPSRVHVVIATRADGRQRKCCGVVGAAGGSLSTDSIHRVVEGVDHPAMIADGDGAAATTRAILDVVSSIRTGRPLAGRDAGQETQSSA